ncbi:MAG: hypothetical protein J6V04_07165 [Bacteroidales bacterium]|nr:hypothetical protein [Bacteroidales bacterium]
MRKLLIILTLMTIGTAYCHAQYFGSYSYTQVAEGISKQYKLNSVTFNEDEIRNNPDSWAYYLEYLEKQNSNRQEMRKYSIAAFSGLGAMCISAIPFCINYSDNTNAKNIAHYCGYGLLTAGGICAIVGAIGVITFTKRINNNKREMIVHLQTTNNGLGIITVF